MSDHNDNCGCHACVKERLAKTSDPQDNCTHGTPQHIACIECWQERCHDLEEENKRLKANNTAFSIQHETDGKTITDLREQLRVKR